MFQLYMDATVVVLNLHHIHSREAEAELLLKPQLDMYAQKRETGQETTRHETRATPRRC